MIRLFEPKDWEQIWLFMEPVFRAGKTYAYSPQISESEAYDVWVNQPLATFVSEEEGEIFGTYFIKPNQPGLGSHVCNCGYIVSNQARGRGIASRMCDHSQAEAISRGFLAMQFNLVVSTNDTAVQLWKKHGFAIIGTLPGAFRDLQQGFVDAFVMFKPLRVD